MQSLLEEMPDLNKEFGQSDEQEGDLDDEEELRKLPEEELEDRETKKNNLRGHLSMQSQQLELLLQNLDPAYKTTWQYGFDSTIVDSNVQFKTRGH